MIEKCHLCFVYANEATRSNSQMGPLQVSDHMVQKPPYWNANCPLGHLRQLIESLD